MTRTITLSDSTYSRLEQLASGFDTPERVIMQLLDNAHANGGESTISKPTLTFNPDELSFKSELLIRKKAQVILKFESGERDVVHWNASRLQPSSNLRANLWSGVLRNWKDKRIVSADLSVLPKGQNHPEDETKTQLQIAEAINWTFEEVNDYLLHLDNVHPYYSIAKFSDETPAKLKQIGGLNDSYERRLDFLGSSD